MRIALVIERLVPERGGAEQWTWQFAQGLVARGHQVHVVAAEFSAEARRLALKLHPLAPRGGRLAFAAAAAEVIGRLEVDVVHDMGLGFACDVFQPHGGSRRAAAERNRQLQPAWVRPFKRLAERALPRYRQFEALIERQYARDGRIFVALSQMVAAHFRRWHAVPSESIRLVYNGVDTRRFSLDHCRRYRDAVRQQLRVGPREVLVAIVAHNFRLKGVGPLCQAIARGRAAGAPLRCAVVGGGKAGPYRRLARRLGIEQAVTFAGATADPVPWYAAADVYAQPTFYDPCSLVVLEAAACGLPVVTTRYNGAAELFEPGISAVVLDEPGAIQPLADALAWLADPAVRGTMAEAARDLALRRTLARNCDELLMVYEEIAGRGRRAA